ncbi:hypothetical protein KM043_006149 [Ampulex compressa]|nr:hypothetical protein KM043_006149 [Ampulex compressa]
MARQPGHSRVGGSGAELTLLKTTKTIGNHRKDRYRVSPSSSYRRFISAVRRGIMESPFDSSFHRVPVAFADARPSSEKAKSPEILREIIPRPISHARPWRIAKNRATRRVDEPTVSALLSFKETPLAVIEEIKA